MTSATETLLVPAHPTRSKLWGELGEFLMVGGTTLLLLPLAILYRDSAGLDWSEYRVSFLAFYAAYVINDPHFAVTYLLFYKDAKNRALGNAFGQVQRIRYWVAGAIVPLGLASWGAVALATQSGTALGLMIQLMFFLVGWHYVKQGFGVLTVLSSRRGVRFSKLERNTVLAHCFSGWAYAWASPYDPGRQYLEQGVTYTSLPHPPWLEEVTLLAFASSTLALVLVFARKWRNEGRPPPLAPLAGFLITVWFWTVFSSLDPLLLYVIPALHSIQYLYFVWLLRRNEVREQSSPNAFRFRDSMRWRLGIFAVSALALGWFLFRGAPTFLDETFVLHDEGVGGVGPTPYLAAIFTFVNIHHYFMDHVIWRRENPATRFLRN